MKRIARWTASSLAATGLVTGAVISTGLDPANADGGRSHSTTLSFTTQEIASTFLGEATQVSADRLVSGGGTVGFASTHCDFNFTTELATCDVAAALAGGLLYAHITVDANNNVSKGSVTGGTGAYAKAHGTVTGGPGADPSQTRVTIVYTTPGH